MQVYPRDLFYGELDEGTEISFAVVSFAFTAVYYITLIALDMLENNRKSTHEDKVYFSCN